MKRNRVFLLGLLLGMSLLTFADKKPTHKETVLFSVHLHCQGCADKIYNNLRFEKGVTNLKVSFEKKEVEVTYRKDKTDVEKLKKALELLGYPAEEVQPNSEQKQKER